MTEEHKNSPAAKTGALQYIRTIYLSIAAVIGLVCFIIGASGAVKLVLNVWFPVDDYVYYSSPYEKSQCEVRWVNGQEVPSTPQEADRCEERVKENNKLMARNNFNRELTQSVSLTLVGFPVWLLHFWLIQQDWKRRAKA
jgi:hypothetical protein